MAQYMFIKTRQAIDSANMLLVLEQVCGLLTPAMIKEESQNTVAVWPQNTDAFYAIQNSERVATPTQDTLIIGQLHPSSNTQSDTKQSELYHSEADGSYAIIKSTKDEIAFFSDQFGSRTLWYYFDANRIIVSTSQRAIVALKGVFRLNKTALAWYLSAGCQGPFISWDQDIKQVRPHLEYKLNVTDWCLNSIQKPGMDLPLSGSTNLSDYLKRYQAQVTVALDHIINSYPNHQTLLPLSGGLDSRLLLALSKNANLEDEVTLVNWGVDWGALHQEDVFDDKMAAHRVASFYSKTLLDKVLPIEIDTYDQVLDRFVEASEGRIDHFNAFSDGFLMWGDFFQRGYRMIIRGDIPFPTGLCLNAVQIRTKMGLDLFSDYSNIDDFNVKEYSELQSEHLSARLYHESLIRWRDRTFTGIRIPTVLAAFSQQTSAFTESRTPMLNWTLFKLYMGLPDKEKGNKQHIKTLWKTYDHSEVSSKTSDSLRSMNAYFESDRGRQYLHHKLVDIKKRKHLSLDFVDSVHHVFLKQMRQQHISPSNSTLSLKSTAITHKTREWLSNNLPNIPKAYLKSKRAKRLSATTLAYRIVLAEKIIILYESDTQQIGGCD